MNVCERAKTGKRMAAVVIVLLIGAAAAVTAGAAEKRYEVNYRGAASDGESMASRFIVDGRPAFCCDDDKITPATGTLVTKTIKEDAEVAKVLYYGYGGPEQWEGFADDDTAVVATSLALDHCFNGGDGRGNSNYLAFMEFLSTKDADRSGTSYILYNSSRHVDQRLAAGIPPVTVKVSVTKESACGELTDGNDLYSLAGAVYGVYCGDRLLAELVTDETGRAEAALTMRAEEAEDLTVKELKASAGYALDDSVYRGDGSSGEFHVVSKEPPAASPAEILLFKYDEEVTKGSGNGGYRAQKGGTLAGGIFRVDHYDLTGEEAPENDDYSRHEPLRTWYFATDDDGRICWDESYFAAGYEQSELYRDRDDENSAVIPLGLVTIREIIPPAGYLLSERLYVCAVEADDAGELIEVYQAPYIPNGIARGDLELIKEAGDSGERMAGIPFMVTSLTESGGGVEEGERHVIVTDENGYFSTALPAGSSLEALNSNDAAWDGDKISDAALDPDAGIWFGEKNHAGSGKGALPYGRYRIDELPCARNEGYILIEGLEISVSEEGQKIDLGTLVNEREEPPEEEEREEPSLPLIPEEPEKPSEPEEAETEPSTERPEAPEMEPRTERSEAPETATGDVIDPSLSAALLLMTAACTVFVATILHWKRPNAEADRRRTR